MAIAVWKCCASIGLWAFSQPRFLKNLIRGALIPVEDGYTTTDIQVSAGKIAEIAPNLPGAGREVNAANKLLLPGFLNGHTHASQVWQRGLIPQLPLELWLADGFDTSVEEIDQICWGAVSTAVDMVLSGGTCVLDHLFLPVGHESEAIAAAVQAYKTVGIRAVIAPLIMDLPFVARLPQGRRSLTHKPYPWAAPEILAWMAEIITQFHEPEAGIYIGVGPTGFHRCLDELLVGCAELSDRHNLCRHTHLLETKAQSMLAQERYGTSAVQHLQKLGFLDHRTTLAHSVWLEDTDLEILADTKSTVVHNPLSNLRLGSGIAPILKCIAAGVNVAFGCDRAASNDGQDLLEAIKLGTILHNLTDRDYTHWITPRQAIAMAAMGGATGVNLAAQTGSLAVSKDADFVLYDLENLSMLPRTDPVQLLIYGRPNQVVDSVWVKGRAIVANGKLATLDVEDLKQALRHPRQKQSPEHFQTIHTIEPHYRTIMNLD